MMANILSTKKLLAKITEQPSGPFILVARKTKGDTKGVNSLQVKENNLLA